MKSSSKPGKFANTTIDVFSLSLCGVYLILYYYRQPLPDDEQNNPEGQEVQEENQEQQPTSENYCDFTIYVSDKSGKKGLVVEATSMDTEISFNSITISEDVSASKK